MSKVAKGISLLVSLGIVGTQLLTTGMEVSAAEENVKANVAILAQTANTTGVPAQGSLSKEKWDGETDYTISMNLWWGNNADSWRIYENGKLVAEEPLVNNSPNPQKAEMKFTNKPNGNYEYTVELVNSFGVTKLNSTVSHKVTKNETKLDIQLPESASGKPAVGYKVISEDDNSFTYAFYVANPNKSYVWAGNDFSVWGINFEMEGTIKDVEGAGTYTQDGNKVSLKLKQDEQLLPFDTMRVITVQGEKNGKDCTPKNIAVDQFRGNVPYPEYEGLPSSWEKGKKDLKASDLIADEKDYYDTKVNTNTGNKLINYNPSHKTQMVIGLPDKMPVKVNGVSDLKIWMPSKYLAMGLATDSELFKLNANYMVGLSIKENFTCGLAPEGSGYSENMVEVDGKNWSWPIQKKHPDGPFQQEKGNFNEVKKQNIDYLPATAEHGDYVSLKTGEADDPSYVSSAISSGISLTTTREFLYAIPKNDFEGFLKQAKDPWAEYVLVDNAYNRGVYGLLQRNLFTTNREQAINATDLNKEFDLSGFASHIETIRAIIEEMDKEENNIYDSKITWQEMENYFKELRMFYGNGVPSDAEWNAMLDDCHNAFNVLSAHWGDGTVSFRYDFLTILRVAREYFPEITNPAPSGATWVEQVNGGNR